MTFFARLVLCGLTLGTSPLLHAHADILATTPKAGALIAKVPQSIVIKFSKPSYLTTVQLTGPKQKITKLNAGALPQPAKDFSVPVPTEALKNYGRYLVNYVYLSKDGHSVKKSFHFSLTP